MKNINFVEQSIPMPDEFKAAVTRAALDFFPNKREIYSVDRLLKNHVEALEASISLEFSECQVRGESDHAKIIFIVDLSKGDTGFALIDLPITCEGGAVYLDGV